MRVEGTPHNWIDAQNAWDDGRMGNWPAAKGAHAMGHYEKTDIPFQYALADAFTLCDAYHCSFQGGTNTNRLFLWTGTNDGEGKGGGPSISNTHDHLPKTPTDKATNAYRWTTYPERLQAAGIDWRIYEDMADNFGDNPLIGFHAFRESLAKGAGSDPQLAARGLSTQHLDALKSDVLAGKLPQVSWIISPAKDSEHPGPSSPAQGADYTARVIEALTADPEVWAKTVLLVTFDENDGFFDHVPPPAPPGKDETGALMGASTVDTTGEYHLVRSPADPGAERDELMGRPYGLGPRVPMYVISPWSRGGWVNSQVFDHTSMIRFLEERFGVAEPNITPWRRAVCGDLTSAFDFRTPNNKPFPTNLPATAAVAARAAALPGRTTPPTPAEPAAPVQAEGVRPSRALPYAHRRRWTRSKATPFACPSATPARPERSSTSMTVASGPRSAPLHHRSGQNIRADWPSEIYDLWVLGPNGFHRHYVGRGGGAPLFVTLAPAARNSVAMTHNRSGEAQRVTLTHNAYAAGRGPRTVTLNAASGEWKAPLDLKASHGWYDITLRPAEGDAWLRRLAGRIETGADSITDPAMAGAAMMRQV